MSSLLAAFLSDVREAGSITTACKRIIKHRAVEAVAARAGGGD